jgi:transcription-repair coupling factor (superfamily II helicase)
MLNADWRKGFQYAPDSLQNELESSFIYEDNSDQTKSYGRGKKYGDDRPMDRFVAMLVSKDRLRFKVAFKAVDNGKQVAIFSSDHDLAISITEHLPKG